MAVAAAAVPAAMAEDCSPTGGSRTPALIWMAFAAHKRTRACVKVSLICVR